MMTTKELQKWADVIKDRHNDLRACIDTDRYRVSDEYFTQMNIQAAILENTMAVVQSAIIARSIYDRQE